MREILKDIVDYPGYKVSSLGYVISTKYLKPRILKMYPNKDGYLTVSLCKNGKQKTFGIHRLVADAFITNSFNYDSVDHINGDKTDNRSCNLQWLSHSDNVVKYHKAQGHIITGESSHNRYGGRKRGETKRITVGQFTKDGRLLEIFESFMDAERKTGVTSGRISLVVNGKKKTAGGFLWKKM